MCNSFNKLAAKYLGEEVRIAPVGTGTGAPPNFGSHLKPIKPGGQIMLTIYRYDTHQVLKATGAPDSCYSDWKKLRFINYFSGWILLTTSE